ncbi:MAG: ribbon-helix-helix protein, CopG family [Myxococcales bacterium]|nr:ribbon-helix-helix protein, CopG family [Myxococcales bacterium]
MQVTLRASIIETVARNPENPQWSIQVETDLDKAVEKAAKAAGMAKSAFVRAVLRGYLELPGGLK